MNKLKLAINKELDVMVELGITAEEWFFIQLLFLLEEGDDTSLFRYFTEAKKDDVPKELLESLKAKNIIKWKSLKEGEPFKPSSIKFEITFLKKYYKSSLEMGEELLKAFPIFIFGKTGSYPVKNFTKLFRSLEDFCFAYSKSIKFNPETHQEILQLIEWAKDNNMITFSIGEFVVGRKWIDLKELHDNGTNGAQFDNIEVL